MEMSQSQLKLNKFFKKSSRPSEVTTGSSNTSDPLSQSLPSSETATSSSISCIPTDSNSDQSDTEDFQPSPSKQPRIEVSVVNLDVADLARRRSSLTNSEKYDFYCDHFIPDIDYKFPREGGCGFLYRFLRKYNWLVYSRQANGGYCLPCVLFGRSTDARKGKGVFVEAAFMNFKKVHELCDFHASREYHKDAVAACDAFVEVMSGRRESVAVKLSQDFRDTVLKNWQMLRSIVDTIVLCGRQNIALRGHRDSATDLEGQDAQSNHGNFWALLNFRVSSGDTHLRDHLQRAARNATYTSPDTQNQLINILGDQIRDTILKKVRSSLCYTVIADEVTDFSNKEQLSLVLRYVDPEISFIREDLVTFLECDR